MLKKLTVYAIVLGLGTMIVVIIGSTLLSSQQTMSAAMGLGQLLEDFDWVLRLWRYACYVGIFLCWPALGRKMRARDSRDWNDNDVRGWNGYRYRLVAILIVIDVCIIDRWPFRLTEALS